MVRLSIQLHNGNMETIILHEVVYLPGRFNLISTSHIVAKAFEVRVVTYHGVDRCNPYGKLSTTAPQVDCLLKSGTSARIDHIHWYQQ